MKVIPVYKLQQDCVTNHWFLRSVFPAVSVTSDLTTTPKKLFGLHSILLGSVGQVKFRFLIL